jgi:2',3'-cyclic-nucleotide 3'-phosphodiesterase
MINQYIHLMCGIPGSGKSTWIAKQMKNDKCIHISRDAVRKSMVGEDANDNQYFSKENAVFNEFVRQINDAISLGYEHIFIDATHINEASRSKILNQLYVNENSALILEVFTTPVEECQRRNANRTGFARVPESAIERMHRSFKYPTRGEFTYRTYGFERISINEHACKEGNSL